MLLTALMKAELRRVLTVTLETNTSFTPNRTHSLAMSITLSAIRSLSPSALRYGNPACGDSTGSNRIEKNQARVLPRPV